MSQEIERKFLVTGEGWRALAPAVTYRQGYLSLDKERTVRVRTAGERAYLCVKGITRGCTRLEFEYEIPMADALEMIEKLAIRPIIEKNRTRAEVNGRVWEIDEFFGENAGLVIAEVELPDETVPLVKPDWIGKEVSDDPRYYNACLQSAPYASWPENQPKDH
jgi:adenylate cyclase